jgi:hypothetical protein
MLCDYLVQILTARVYDVAQETSLEYRICWHKASLLHLPEIMPKESPLLPVS